LQPKKINLKEKEVLTDHPCKLFSLTTCDGLLYSAGEREIKVWNTQTFRCVETVQAHEGTIHCMCKADQYLISGGGDRTFHVWDRATMKLVRTGSDEKCKVLSMAVAENTLYTASQNCKIKLWDLRCAESQQTIDNAHRWDIWQIVLAGGYLFSGSFDHSIKVWDLRQMKCLQMLKEHKSFIHALTANYNCLFSGSGDQTIKVWSEQNK